MPTHTTSSARPEALERFVAACDSTGAHLRFGISRLESALERLSVACREYPVPGCVGLAGRLRADEQSAAELAAWVLQVAAGFRHADGAALPDWRAAELPQADTPSSAVLDELARWPVLPSPLWPLLIVPPVRERWPEWDDPGEDLGAAWLDAATAQLGSVAETIGDYAAVIADDVLWCAWTYEAARLDMALTLINVTILFRQEYTGVAITALAPVLIESVVTLSVITVLHDGPRWRTYDIEEPDEIVKLFMQGFWNTAFGAYPTPPLLNHLADQLDALNRYIKRATDDLGSPRPISGPAAEPRDPLTGAINLPLNAFVSEEMLIRLPNGHVQFKVAALMAGLHALLSSFLNEQITMFQCDEGVYAFAITGLDPINMHLSPNSTGAVMDTAYNPALEQNAYYVEIRQRFMDYIRGIPPGSITHYLGHSMGGGMVVLLLNDPQVQQLLHNRDLTVKSVTTLGMVRPMDASSDNVPSTVATDLEGELFEDTVVRHYVDTDDRLAMNVGAGHSPEEYANVIPLNNDTIDDPVDAHTSYEDPEKYAELTPELQALGFDINPPKFKVYREPPPPIPDLPPSRLPVEPPISLAPVYA